MPPLNRRSMRRAERALSRRDPVMAWRVSSPGPYTLDAPPKRPPFEALAQAIAHQQLNGVVADRILARFTALYTPAEFPEPTAVAATPDEMLRAAGFSFAKIRALRDLAHKVIAGIVPTLAELHTLEDQVIIERITQVRGIGRWTVEMMLMFQLGRPDVLPVDDFGVASGFRLAYGLKGMPRPRALAQFGERWAPHRSLAAWYLWRAVDLSRDGKLPRAGRAPRVALKQTRPKPAAKPRKPASKRKRSAGHRHPARHSRSATRLRKASGKRTPGSRLA
jgi:DNA-3-methyladenine glycosylase II